jgi:hypothetical protein
MTSEVKKNEEGVTFLNPELISVTMLEEFREFCVSYMKRAYQQCATKNVFIGAYYNACHWIVVVDFPKQNMVLYLDSLKSLGTDISILSEDINE